jgi:flagellar motor switch protein FliM
MEKVLNQEEIDAMVRAARSGNAATGAQASGPVVQPWDIRQAGQIGRDQMRSISQLHEIFARNLTHSIGAYLRIVFECGLVSAEHLTFREFLQRIPESTYLASCNLVPVDVMAVLQIDLAIAFPIIDLMLGGEGKGGVLKREITEIEEEVIESIVRIICRELQNTWQPLSLEFNFGQRQPAAQAQRLMPPEEKNLCLSFEIKMAETRGTLNLAVPAVVSNALLRKISANYSYQRPRGPIEARHQIQKRLLECPFPVELCVPHLQVPLETLAALAPGAVLSFSRNASAPAALLVDEIRLGSAMPVRVNSRRAARVVALEPTTPPAGAR